MIEPGGINQVFQVLRDLTETGGQVYCFGGKVLNSFEVISNIRQKLGEQGDRAGRSIRYSGAS